MTTKKTKKKSTKHARRPNPSYRKAQARTFKKSYRPKKHRKSNPSFGALSRPIEVLKLGAYALIGLVLTRQIAQMVLKTRNSGPIGYLANGATAIAAGYGASRFVSRPAGAAVAIGGGLYLVNRILSEQLSPIGQYLALAGTGDAAAAPTVGRLRYSYFPFPVMRDNKGNIVIPKEIDAQAAAAAAAAAARPALTAAPALQGRGMNGSRLAA